MKIMKKTLLMLILYFLVAGISLARNPSRICFGKTCVDLEIADTESSRARGLMFREDLPENSGMLFVFPEEGIYSFWMKNTLLSLDMIWLDKDLKVVQIKSSVPVCATPECPSYDPQVKAKYVLEVNAGFALRHGILINDKAFLQ